MSSSDFFNYSNIGVFAGSNSPYSPSVESTGITNLYGIQSSSVSLDYPRSEIVSWDGNGDQVLTQRPRAELLLSYVFSSGVNEPALGLFVSQGTVAPALKDINQERNYYIAYNEDHRDILGSLPKDSKIMAFGNGLLTHYELSSSVGQPTSVSANIQALNLLIQPSGTGQIVPSISKSDGTASIGPYTLPIPASNAVSDYFESTPSSLFLSFDSGCSIGSVLSGQTLCPIQSFGFSIDLPRAESKNLGWAYPEFRPVSWPATINLQTTAYLTEFQEDSLNRFGCPDSGVNFTIRFKNSCSSFGPISFAFSGAKLSSQNFRNQIGAFSQVSMNWTLKIFDINRSYPNFYIFKS